MSHRPGEPIGPMPIFWLGEFQTQSSQLFAVKLTIIFSRIRLKRTELCGRFWVDSHSPPSLASSLEDHVVIPKTSSPLTSLSFRPQGEILDPSHSFGMTTWSL